MTYMDFCVWLLDGCTDRMIDLADTVGRETGSDAARAGAVFILFPVSLLICGIGLVALLISAPFYIAWAVGAMVWAGIKRLRETVK